MQNLAYIEISKKNLIHNIRQFKNLAKRGTKITAVIKANAYGHGDIEVVKILAPYADYFAVNSVQELENVRKASHKKTFVLGYVQESDLLKAIKLKCILSVFSLSQIQTLSAIARGVGVIQEVQIVCDAFLGREGFLAGDLPALFKVLKKIKNIKVTGMYAHFANIEDTTDFTHAGKQIKEYEKMLAIAGKFGFKNLQTHISATSGLLAYEGKKGLHPIVRTGIGLYGMWPSERLKSNLHHGVDLKPVLSWKTKIAQIKNLPAGSTIGYGLTYRTKKKTKVAVIPQGYADGFDRRFSNNGEVLIKGTRCKILGRVMMNMFVVDVNHLKNVKAEDEVVIIGRQARQEITAEELADRLSTINYEITTRISPLLPKIIK